MARGGYAKCRYKPGFDFTTDAQLIHYKVDLNMSIQEILDRTGITETRLDIRLKSLGISDKHRMHPVTLGHHDDKLRELVAKGFTGRTIESLLQCSSFTVRRRLSVLGLKLRTNKNTSTHIPRLPVASKRPVRPSKGSGLLRSLRFDSVLGRK